MEIHKFQKKLTYLVGIIRQYDLRNRAFKEMLIDNALLSNRKFSELKNAACGNEVITRAKKIRMQFKIVSANIKK